MNWNSTSRILALALILPCGSALAAAAGQITLLSGQATAASPEGGIRALKKGDSVYSREFVSTSNNSFANIKFADGGAVLVKPNSRFQIEQFTMGGSGSSSAPKTDAQSTAPAPAVPRTRPIAFFRLLKGGFRAVSGLIGKKDRGEYRITTPVATIGIRGTDYEAILCDDVCAKDPVILENVGATANPEGGLVASVITGGIGVTPKGTTVAMLRSYQAIARALHLEPTGIVKVAARPQWLRVADGGSPTHDVNAGETYFFPRGGHPPLHLPGMNPNIDSGLNGYDPKAMCK